MAGRRGLSFRSICWLSVLGLHLYGGGKVAAGALEYMSVHPCIQGPSCAVGRRPTGSREMIRLTRARGLPNEWVVRTGSILKGLELS